MLPKRFNNHYMEKRCPICQRAGGVLSRQAGPVKDLGLTGDYAHLQCVIVARKKKEVAEAMKNEGNLY